MAELIHAFFFNIEGLAVLLSVLATVLGAGVSAFSRRRTSTLLVEFDPGTEPSLDPQKDSRLNDAFQALSRQEKAAKWNTWASNLLIVGQYIIGGVLASSFVQDALSSQMVGILGLLVLISSLTHQRFRPDLIASGAKHRSASLRALIRRTEDDLFALKQGLEDAPSIFTIRAHVTSRLEEIEENELLESTESKSDNDVA